MKLIEFHVWVRNEYKGVIRAPSHSLAVKLAIDDFQEKDDLQVYRVHVEPAIPKKSAVVVDIESGKRKTEPYKQLLQKDGRVTWNTKRTRST